jgi:tetratricopeptide (TPR) repeat protein
MYLEGRPADALKALEGMLAADADYIEALRLKGNILEVAALEQADRDQDTPLKHPGMWEARRCYERILQLDPDNTLALIDLGDHFGNLYAYEKAEDFYQRAIALLERGVFRWSLGDEIQEVFDALADLYDETGRTPLAQTTRDRQAELLTRLPPAEPAD